MRLMNRALFQNALTVARVVHALARVLRGRCWRLARRQSLSGSVPQRWSSAQGIGSWRRDVAHANPQSHHDPSKQPVPQRRGDIERPEYQEHEAQAHPPQERRHQAPDEQQRSAPPASGSCRGFRDRIPIGRPHPRKVIAQGDTLNEIRIEQPWLHHRPTLPEFLEYRIEPGEIP